MTLRAWFGAAFEMQEAGSVSEAIRMLEDFKPSLLITDYSLPDANGSELIERAKAAFPDIKCLLLTGWRDITDHRSFRRGVLLQKLYLVAQRQFGRWRRTEPFLHDPTQQIHLRLFRILILLQDVVHGGP